MSLLCKHSSTRQQGPKCTSCCWWLLLLKISQSQRNIFPRSYDAAYPANLIGGTRSAVQRRIVALIIASALSIVGINPLFHQLNLLQQSALKRAINITCFSAICLVPLHTAAVFDQFLRQLKWLKHQLQTAECSQHRHYHNCLCPDIQNNTNALFFSEIKKSVLWKVMSSTSFFFSLTSSQACTGDKRLVVITSCKTNKQTNKKLKLQIKRHFNFFNWLPLYWTSWSKREGRKIFSFSYFQWSNSLFPNSLPLDIVLQQKSLQRNSQNDCNWHCHPQIKLETLYGVKQIRNILTLQRHSLLALVQLASFFSTSQTR